MMSKGIPIIAPNIDKLNRIPIIININPIAFLIPVINLDNITFLPAHFFFIFFATDLICDVVLGILLFSKHYFNNGNVRCSVF